MKICITRIDKMGDMILTLPVIKSLKEYNNSNQIHVISSINNLKICNNFKYINKIFSLNKSLYGFLNIVKEIREEKYEHYFNFSPNWQGILLGIFSKSKKKSILILKSRYKSKIFSKFFQQIIGKIFYDNIYIVDRHISLRLKKNIHQTHLMFSLLKKSGYSLNKNINIDYFFPLSDKIKFEKKICVIHLSHKWLNKYFSEEKFINFIHELLKKDILFLLTTDETTKSKFKKIYKLFDVVNNNNFEKISEKSKIVICNNLNFTNWTSIIYKAKFVITPECGCTHVAALSSCNLCVIYDYVNFPHSIMHEYSPWNKEYKQLISNDNKLSEKLIEFIN